MGQAQLFLLLYATPHVSAFFIGYHQTFLRYESIDLTFRAPCIISVFLLIYFQQDATLHSFVIPGKLLYMFRVVSPRIIRNTHNCIYNIWYLLNRYCYLPLLWMSWSLFECDVGIIIIYNSHTTPKPATTHPQ